MSAVVPDYSEFKEATGEDLLSRISALAFSQKQAELDVAEAEEKLAAAKNTLRDISDRQLPNLMDEAQLTEFTTRDGIKVSVKEVIRASLPKGKEAVAFAWLAAHEHDDLIKREFKVPFDREAEEAASQLRTYLEEAGFSFESKQTIHPQTLAAFVREQLEAGVDIPLEAFGAARVKSAKITFKG